MGDKKVVEAMEPVGLVVVGMVKAQWAVVAMAAVVKALGAPAWGVAVVWVQGLVVGLQAAEMR